MSLRKAYQDMIRVLGVPDTATLMEMSESALDNRVFERRDQEFKVRQGLRLQEISGTTRFAEEIAKMSGGTFVALPQVDHVDNESLLGKFNELYTEVGKLSAEFAEATKSGDIDASERARLEEIAAELHQTTEELLALTFSIYCPASGKSVIPTTRKK